MQSGLPGQTEPRWRELDMHDTFLAADYSHPGDNIPPILAVAQQCGCSGKDLLRGVVAAYEIHVCSCEGDMSAQTQERPHCPSLSGSSSGKLVRCWALGHGTDLPSHTTSRPCLFLDATVAQGRDFELESLCSGTRRQAGRRSG